MVGVAICLLVERALHVLIPRQLGILVNLLGAKDAGSFQALSYFIFFTWLGSYSGVRAIRSQLWLPVDANAQSCLSMASYNHIMDLSCDFHEEKQFGELTTAVSQGDSLVSLLEMLLYQLIPVCIDLMVGLGYFYILFDTYLVLIGVATTTLYLWASIYVTASLTPMQRKANACSRRTTQVVYDTMGEWKTVSYFNRFAHAKSKHSASVTLFQSLWVRAERFWYIAHGLLDLILDIGCFGAFFFAIYHVVFGQQSVGSFIALLTYWNTFTCKSYHTS